MWSEMPYLQDLPAFQRYNDQLADARRVVKRELKINTLKDFFRPDVKTYSPPSGSYLDRKFKAVWGGDTVSWRSASFFVQNWAFEKSHAPFYRDLVAAWLKIAGDEDPETRLEISAAVLYLTRRERWQRLADGLHIEPPTEFLLYRGVKGRVFVEDVVNSWRLPGNTPLTLRHHPLTSWSLNLEKPEGFAIDHGRDRYAGVVHRAVVPFENTLADKFVDDSSFVVPWNDQNEVVVATSGPDVLLVDKFAAVVWYLARRYTYSERDELIRSWEAGKR